MVVVIWIGVCVCVWYSNLLNIFLLLATVLQHKQEDREIKNTQSRRFRVSNIITGARYMYL